MFAHWRQWTVVCVLAGSLSVPGMSADSKKAKKVIVPVKVDESAEHIDVFEGLESGALEVKMVPKDAFGGNMFIENKGDKPLNVDFPAVFVGRQVLKQFGGAGGGLGGGGLGGGGLGGGGLGGGGLGGGGGGQSQGGGLGGGGGGLGGGGLGGGGLGGGGLGGGGGGGFFSIPPDRIVRVPYRAVCLEHGKADPSPRMTYQITKIEDFSENPVLPEVLRMVAEGKLDPQAAQAATWHITDKMSWEELTAKSIRHVGGRPPTPYFTLEQLAQARSIFTTAVARANEKSDDPKKPSVATTDGSRRNSATVKRDSD